MYALQTRYTRTISGFPDIVYLLGTSNVIKVFQQEFFISFLKLIVTYHVQRQLKYYSPHLLQ